MIWIIVYASTGLLLAACVYSFVFDRKPTIRQWTWLSSWLVFWPVFLLVAFGMAMGAYLKVRDKDIPK